MPYLVFKLKRENSMTITDVTVLDGSLKKGEMAIVVESGKIYYGTGTGKKLLNPYRQNTLTGTSENDIIMDGGTF